MSIHPRTQTLARRHSPLSDTFFQLEVLNGRALTDTKIPPFSETISQVGYSDGVLRPTRIEILQVNVGKLCNQACAHCHVDAGPDRKRENMTKETFDLCLEVLRRYEIPTVDITGGAPEMNPHFRWFVEQCSALGKRVLNRCNLTIILVHERYRDLPQFFAQHGVEVISSLPHYNARRTDSQRGDGVFEASIEALRLLNAAGYGQPDSGLKINLVYNPTGTFLPGNQQALEREFKAQLQRRYGVVFNQLYAITNMPISRFLDYLLESGQYDTYMQTLLDAFNPAAVAGVMCRNTISVSWEGYLYDCDFNQMLDLKVNAPGVHIRDFDLETLEQRSIVLNQHCYGCTAGAGSSCGGQVV